MVADIVGELGPFSHTRHMPTIRTNALHIRRVGRAGARTVHDSRPVVEQTWQSGSRIEIVWSGCRHSGVRRNLCAIRIARGAQILPHPALVADLHRVIDIVVDVCHRRYSGTGFCIAGRDIRHLGDVHYETAVGRGMVADKT